MHRGRTSALVATAGIAVAAFGEAAPVPEAVDRGAGTLNHLFDFDSPHFGKLILDPTTGLRV